MILSRFCLRGSLQSTLFTYGFLKKLIFRRWRLKTIYSSYSTFIQTACAGKTSYRLERIYYPNVAETINDALNIQEDKFVVMDQDLQEDAAATIIQDAIVRGEMEQEQEVEREMEVMAEEIAEEENEEDEEDVMIVKRLERR